MAMASGLAKGGARPVFGTFSTFFQRTYDQLSQDVCINGNPAVFLVFGASAFALNDVTHLGLFDIPMMSNIPSLSAFRRLPRQNTRRCLPGPSARRNIPWPSACPSSSQKA